MTAIEPLVPESLVPYANAVFGQHAADEVARRGLTEEDVRRVLSGPHQQWGVRDGRVVCQARITRPDWQRPYLVRVFLDIDRDPPRIVTAYRSSKIEKYWRSQ